VTRVSAAGSAHAARLHALAQITLGGLRRATLALVRLRHLLPVAVVALGGLARTLRHFLTNHLIENETR